MSGDDSAEAVRSLAKLQANTLRALVAAQARISELKTVLGGARNGLVAVGVPFDDMRNWSVRDREAYEGLSKRIDAALAGEDDQQALREFAQRVAGFFGHGLDEDDMNTVLRGTP